MNPKIEFLHWSIEDAQGTIRALDVKLGAILLVLIVPMGSLDGVYEKVAGLLVLCVWWAPLIAVFAVSWLLAVWAVFMGLAAIGDPRNTLSGSTPEGVFFGGGYFDFDLRDAFFNWRKKSSLRIKEVENDLPDDETAICKELVFEKIKLAYIRGLKIERAKSGSYLTLVFIISGAIIWMLYLVKVGHA